MATDVMKLEVEVEVCCVCGGGGDLLTPEEHDSAREPLAVPLRTMLAALTPNKVVPEGRLCGNCAARAVDAHELGAALAARAQPPLSDRIRALRQRLHDLTQKIDVFIVVGGPGGASGGAAAYSEDDIIMVEADALAAAASADRDQLPAARSVAGDHVFQCSVCPVSFQRASELRAHAASHPGDALHSCWTCGAQFPDRGALTTHAATHTAPGPPACALCGPRDACAAQQRRHEATCQPRCPACGSLFSSRAALSTHALESHARGHTPPLVCSICFTLCASGDLLAAHALRHRQARQFVCGYGACVVRFGSRAQLLAHIRAAHAPVAPVTPQPHGGGDAACDKCSRSFATPAALKRHMRVHERAARQAGEGGGDGGEEDTRHLQFVVSEDGADDGEVEYLEVETLEDGDYIMQTE